MPKMEQIIFYNKSFCYNERIQFRIFSHFQMRAVDSLKMVKSVNKVVRCTLGEEGKWKRFLIKNSSSIMTK